MKHRKSENRTRQQKQQPTTVTISMLICRGDTHPNLGLFDQVDVYPPDISSSACHVFDISKANPYCKGTPHISKPILTNV